MSTPAATPAGKRLLSVVDAPPSVQQWVDVFIESAVTSTPAASWPHAHTDIPVSTVSLKELWTHIEDVFTLNGQPWSVLARGFPPPVAEPVRAPDASGVTPGDRGFYHTLLHRMLGDFHKHEG